MQQRNRSWIAAAAAVLAACGGGAGVLALLPYVAPIGGFWQSLEASDPNATFSFSFQGGQNNLFGGSNASYPATLTSHSTACGAADTPLDLTATFSGRDFSLSRQGAASSCLTGTFVDDITLVIATGGAGTRFRNQLALQPLFEQGVWADIDQSTRKLRFRSDLAASGGVNTQTGCEFTDGVPTGAVTVRYRNGNAATGTLMSIDSIAIVRAAGTETWTNGGMFGASGIKITGPDGATISLQRLNESPAC